jgi:hypothetical protein
MRRYFSLIFFPPHVRRDYGDVHLIRIALDWLSASPSQDEAWPQVPPYYSLTVCLLGFGASLAFWPEGKA